MTTLNVVIIVLSNMKFQLFDHLFMYVL